MNAVDPLGTASVAADLLETMLRIRIFEERTADLVEAREIRTPTHLCIGQEAISAGVCAALQSDDHVFGNHRSHGHYLAQGGDMRALMAEIYGRETGCSRGRGGSMHLYAAPAGLMGTVPMVGATIPIAVGSGLTALLSGLNRVSVAFFGDGATEEGVFHEALNFAALKALPVLFVCENNLFSSHLPLRERRAREYIYELAAPYGIPGVREDGNDVMAVLRTAGEAVDRARSGRGPTLLEFMTYRWRGHVGPSYDLDVGIRDRDELDAWMARCPIKRMEEHLMSIGLLTEQQRAALYGRVAAEVEEAVSFARSSPLPDEAEMPLHVFV